MRIGVFGGSFNPVHEGHIALAKEAFSELNLDRLFFVPSRQTPLKDKGILWPAVKRAALLKKALKPHPYLSLSLCEIKRKGESFTVDTLRYFKKAFRGATLYFLAGADNLKNLRRWKSPERIFKLSRFVAMTRPGYRLDVSGRLPVLYMPFEALAVSSTSIRKRARRASSKAS